MKRFLIRRLITVLCSAGLFGITTQASASAFQLFEQDGGSYLANFHAGYAASAVDATTAFYNPAGLTRFKNQQVVLAGINVLTDFKYTGTVGVNTINMGTPAPVVGQGGGYSFVPALNYVAPISDWVAFGFSVVVPFGLKTDYGTSTIIRYVATETSVNVVDVSPSLAFKFNRFSLGAGFDIQKMHAEFNSVATITDVNSDTLSTNKADGTGYGYHLGALYEFNDCSRVGLSYHSQVVHHLSGTSRLEGPLADPLAAALEGKLDNVSTSHASTGVTLPAYTALSVYQKVMPSLALMGTAAYTQWSSFKSIILNSVAGLVPSDGFLEPGTIQVEIPQNYHNTWVFSVGADYYATDSVTLRGGFGYDQTPVRSAYRDVRLPDGNRFVIALGGHYQATRCVGVDLGWIHVFVNEVNVHPPIQVAGPLEVTTNGKAKGGADVYGAQITWDM